MRNRLFLLLLLAVLECIPAMALELNRPLEADADKQTDLVLWFHDGTNLSIQLYTKPRITFEGNHVYITSPLVTLDYLANDVVRFTYTSETTSISETGKGTQYQYHHNQIVFDADFSSTDVKLYSEDGRQLPVSLTTADGQTILSLSSLPKGVYILSIKGNNLKILKR